MKFNAVAALAMQASMSAAQMATYSPGQDSSISYAVNVPEASAKSGSGDIFIQIKGPVSGSNARSWIAIGQGSGMPGAQVFIVYPNKAGNNVTLSPRLAGGYYEPSLNNAAKVELLGGTGIESGMLTANIKCSSCNSWSGGQMSFSDSASGWIWSSAAYGPINSDDAGLDIQMHNERGEFTYDLTKATGGSSANPFVTSASSTSGSGGSGNSGTSGNGQSGAGASNGGQDGSTAASSSSGSATSSGEAGALQKLPMVITAHASVMSLAFLFFYPLGAIIMRVGVGKATVWSHAAIQATAYLLALAGMGMGIWIAINLNELQDYHPIIGLVVVCLLVFQAPLGLIHHKRFRKDGSRTLISHAHIWLGRALMTLGAINGGLGLMLAEDGSTPGGIAYGVLAGVIYVGYFALIAGTFGKGKKTAARVQEEKGRVSHSS